MSKRSCLFAGGGVLVLAALGLGLLIWFAPQAGSDTYTVSVIAVVLSLLVGLLFVMAIAYKKMDMFAVNYAVRKESNRPGQQELFTGKSGMKVFRNTTVASFTSSNFLLGVDTDLTFV